MTLDDDIRDAFLSMPVPQTSVDRLQAVDYRPRTSRIPKRLTVGAAAGVAATTAMVVSVTMLTGAPSAFAGWTAQPNEAVHDVSVAPACQTQLDDLATALAAGAVTTGSTGTPIGPGTYHITGKIPPLPARDATWTPVATDERGPFTLQVLGNSGLHIDASCLTGPSVISVVQLQAFSYGSGSSSAPATIAGIGESAGGGPGQEEYTSPLAGSLEALTELFDSPPEKTFTAADGPVASGVTAVTFGLSDGTSVEATVEDGWALAWWPRSASVTTATTTSGSGTTTEPVDIGVPQPSSGTSGNSGTA